VKNTLELFASGHISKHATGEEVAAEAAIRTDDVRAERSSDFRESRLARLDELTSENIGVDDGEAALAEERCRGGFTHADAAR